MKQWRWRLIFVALFVAAVALGLWGARRVTRWAKAELVPLPPLPSLDFRAARLVYPFSVVPGGVYDAQELLASVEIDPIVREHYRGISLEGLAPLRLDQPMLAYVSYRQRDVIGWTRKRVIIPKGELVLTDGRNLVRARCGNRISDAPPEVATPVEDPPEVAMNTPLPPITVLPPNLIPYLPAKRTTWPAWPPDGRRHRPGTHPAPVPEPGTVALFISGVAALGGLGWRRRRR